jgi:hypothetical protein
MRIAIFGFAALREPHDPAGDGAAQPLADAGLAGDGKRRSGADRGGRRKHPETLTASNVPAAAFAP